MYIFYVGPMSNKKQAEISAAEVCLRSLGYLPSVSLDKYVIQPYRGGRIIHSNLKPKSVSALLNDLQQVFCLSKVIFRAKKVQGRFFCHSFTFIKLVIIVILKHIKIQTFSK